MAREVAKPLWIKITGCGFAAVLLSSLAVGGMAFQRQYASGERQMDEKLAKDTQAITADMSCTTPCGLKRSAGDRRGTGNHQNVCRR